MIEFYFKKSFSDFSLDIEFSNPYNPNKTKSSDHLTVLFGPSGTGKSLTLNMLSGIVIPDQGYVRLNGTELFNKEKGINIPIRKRKIGYVFQEYSLFPHLNVYENIAYGINNNSNPDKDIKNLLEIFRLDRKEKRYPHQLSGGQKQRVAIARAIASDPKLLLLDEPLSALDERIREKLQQDLLKLKSILSIPIIYVTHNLQEAFTLADRIIILNDGRIVESGKKHEIFSKPQKRLTAKYLGVKNILPGKITEASKDYSVCEIEGIRVKTDSDTRFKTGDEVFLCIKPQDVRLIVDKKIADNTVDAIVTSTVTLEKTNRVFLKLPQSRYNLIMDLEKLSCEKWKIGIGDNVKVYLRREKIFLTE